MTEIKRYTTESTKNGKTSREERIVYVSRSGEEFETAQDAYHNDILEDLRAILGPAFVCKYPSGQSFHNYDRERGMEQGFDNAIRQMLVKADAVIRLLETWNTNRNS